MVTKTVIAVGGCALALAAAGVALGLGSKPKYFHVGQEDGRWWLFTPSGDRFYSMGVNVVKDGDWSPKEGSPLYRGAEIRGGVNAWVEFTEKRLRDWGFNTVGSWSHREMEKRGIPYCATLHIAPWDPHRLIDVWSRKFEEHLKAEAVKQIGDRSPTDPSLIGYFVCNELPWYGDFGWPTGSRTLFERYMELPRSAPGRKVAARFRKSEADEFAGEVARRFMKIAVAAVKKVDPNHLILGCRIAGGAPAPVIRAIGKHSDVFAMNWYVKDGRPDPAYLDNIYLLAKKPILITEFSYRAMENRGKLKNSRGADVTVATQAERAVRYTRYVETLAALPQVVGFHWFMYFDQPTLGRFDGEDCNYGIVDHADEPYAPLLKAMREMNARVVSVHAESALELPKKPGALRPRPPLPVAGAGKPFAGLDYSAAITTEFWGDREKGFQGSFEIREGRGYVEFETGTGWGGGMKCLRADAPVDLSGAVRLVAVLEAPEGLKFRMFVNEDGVGPRGRDSYAGARGADGEQYVTRELVGTGKTQEYAIPLAELEASGSHGNPAGNVRLDAPAIGHLALSLPGNQGAGTVVLHSIRFE